MDYLPTYLFALICIPLMAVGLANGYGGNKGSQGYLTQPYDKGYPPNYYHKDDQTSPYEMKEKGYGPGYVPSSYNKGYYGQPKAFGMKGSNYGGDYQPSPYSTGEKGQSYGMKGSYAGYGYQSPSYDKGEKSLPAYYSGEYNPQSPSYNVPPYKSSSHVSKPNHEPESYGKAYHDQSSSYGMKGNSYGTDYQTPSYAKAYSNGPIYNDGKYQPSSSYSEYPIY